MNKQENIKVSVIIATMASAERAELLKRAIRSIRSSSVDPIEIIVVVNGARFDPQLVEWVQQQSDISYHYSDIPSAPAAILKGRQLVNTEFFSTLDDDDEYLPSATDLKLSILQKQPQLDLVVGNYYQHYHGHEEFRYSEAELIDAAINPLEGLMRFNWLSSGNALFRTETVGVDYFRNFFHMSEWTWLAFQLAIGGKKIATTNEPVFRCFGDTPNSLSKSSIYFQSSVPLLQKMLDQQPPAHIKQSIRRKISAAHHFASTQALAEQRHRDAWHHHFKSLFNTGGWEYLMYTRHLFYSGAAKK